MSNHALQNTKGEPIRPPAHTQGTLHRRLQPLNTEKYTVSCSGFLPNTNPMQHSCSHYNTFCSSIAMWCIVMWCIDMWCDVLLLHYTSSVTRKIDSQLPLITGTSWGIISTWCSTSDMIGPVSTTLSSQRDWKSHCPARSIFSKTFCQAGHQPHTTLTSLWSAAGFTMLKNFLHSHKRGVSPDVEASPRSVGFWINRVFNISQKR